MTMEIGAWYYVIGVVSIVGVLFLGLVLVGRGIQIAQLEKKLKEYTHVTPWRNQFPLD